MSGGRGDVVGDRSPSAFLITGCGRSGTKYASRMLTSLGIRCTHEQYFTPTTRRAPVWSGGDSSWMSVPFLGELPEIPIVHLVRHPRSVIRSFLSIGFFSTAYDKACAERLPMRLRPPRPLGEAYIRFLRRHSPRTFLEPNAQQRAQYHWVEWNSRVIGSSVNRQYFRIRLEDMSAESIRTLLDFVGVETPTSAIERALRELPPNVNARPRGEYGEDLVEGAWLNDSICELAESLGYEV